MMPRWKVVVLTLVSVAWCAAALMSGHNWWLSLLVFGVWVTPSTRAPGYVVPDTVWNSDVVENPIALRAGAIAIASQAANDMVYVSSATQLARVANGTTDQVWTATTSAAPSWKAAAGGYDYVQMQVFN